MNHGSTWSIRIHTNSFLGECTRPLLMERIVLKACAKEIVLSPLRWGEVRGFAQGQRECWLLLWVVPSYLAQFQCCLLCFGNAPVMMGRLAIVIGRVLTLSCKICVFASGMVWSGYGRRGEKENEKGFVWIRSFFSFKQHKRKVF